MKVIAPGVFFYDGMALIVRGWLFDAEGREFTSNIETGNAMLGAALRFIAETNGVTFAPPAAPPDKAVPASVERETLDAIAAMRWGPGGA